MNYVVKLTTLWPGLPRLWHRGEWSALLTAGGFAVLLNWLLTTTLLWPEVAPVSVRMIGWLGLAVWWPIAVVAALRELPQTLAATDDDPQMGLFISAQAEYLKGNWIETEACLRRLLRRRPQDVEAQLLMAALLRRTRREDAARQQLQQLECFEAADRWRLELRIERQRLRQQTEKQKLEDIQHEENSGGVFDLTQPIADDPPLRDAA